MESRGSFPPELFSDWTQNWTGEVTGYTYTSKQHSCKEYFWEAELNHLNYNNSPWHSFGLPQLAVCQPVHGHSWGDNTHLHTLSMNSLCAPTFSRQLKVWTEMFACQWALVSEKGPRHICYWFRVDPMQELHMYFEESFPRLWSPAGFIYWINRYFWAYHRTWQSIDMLLFFFFEQTPQTQLLF